MIVHAAAQGSLAWHRARLGLPTASMASSLVTPTGRPSSAVEGYADRLAMQRYRGAASDAFAGTDATARGHAFEPRARAAYAWLVGTDVRECGFCTDERGRFGGSPDGLVGDGGGLEIKCPLMPAFVAALMHVEEHGRAPAAYLPQLHMLMLVSGRVWWDLVLWHPELPDEPVIVRTRRDALWDARLLRQIALCRRRRDRVLRTLRARAERTRAGSVVAAA